MLANLIIAFALLLAIGIPAAIPAMAQGNSTVGGNATGPAEDIEDTEDSPFLDDETSTSIDVMINEVELNPRGSDVGKEWIELYNPSDDDADISDFEIRTSFKSAAIELPSDAVIKANETYVVELDRQTLANAAESLELADEYGEIIDSTPSLVDRSDDGRTWQRIPDGNNEWKFVPGTPDELNDSASHASAARSARPGAVACHGTAGCAEGIATRIVDGDTLYVKVNATTYKIDLALTKAPTRSEKGFMDSTSFTRDLCLGNRVLIDQDDEQLTSRTSVIAVVYCVSTNLNSELLDSGHATLDKDQCKTSEFATTRWARDSGC